MAKIMHFDSTRQNTKPLVFTENLSAIQSSLGLSRKELIWMITESIKSTESTRWQKR